MVEVGTHGAENFSLNNCTFEFGSREKMELRFYISAVFPCIVGLLGTIGNTLAVIVFTSKQMRSANSWFLCSLSICDSAVIILTVLTHVVGVLMKYTGSLFLYRGWHLYLRECMVLSHLCKICGVYLMLAAVVERLLARNEAHTGQQVCTGSRTLCTICALFAVATGLAITKYWEIDIEETPQCDGFVTFKLVEGALMQNQIYKTVYSFWITTILFISLPFVSLLVLNVAILCKISREPNQQCTSLMSSPWLVRLEIRNRKARSRETTKMLIVTVFFFLFCNFPSLFRMALEHIHPRSLETGSWVSLLISDTVNIMNVINSTANSAIYFTMSKPFRKQLKRLFKNWTKRKWNKRVGQRETDMTADVILTGQLLLRASQNEHSNGHMAQNKISNLSKYRGISFDIFTDADETPV